MVRLVITGGRDFQDADFVFASLDAVNRKRGVDVLISGNYPSGADKLAEYWASWRNVPVERYPADWKVYGKGAGPKRNQQMIDDGKPDAAVAFPGGRGTADMVGRLSKAKIPCWDRRMERVE